MWTYHIYYIVTLIPWLTLSPTGSRPWSSAYFLIERLQLLTLEIDTILSERRRKHRAEEALRKAYEEVEKRVQERTVELSRANMLLKQEIAERKQAEEALRESENRYARAEEIGNFGHYVRDFAKNKGTWSAQCFRIFGYDPDQFEPSYENLLNLVHPSDREHFKSTVKAAISRGQRFDMEYRIVRPDGTERVIHSVGEVRYDKSGQPIGLDGLVNDITERKLAEEVLSDERDKLEAVTQNIGVGLAIISKGYKTIWANQVLKDIFGDVEGKACYLTYNKRTDVCQGCGVKKVFETGAERAIHEQVGEDADGNTIWSQIIATPIKDEHGNITSALEVVVPVTEHKQAEEALRESQEFNFSLLENAAHPLVVINPDTSIRYINPALEKLTGFTKVELVGRKAPYPWWTKDMTKDNTMEQLRSAMALGVKRLEKCFCKKNGDRFWVELTSMPVKSNEELKYFLGDWVDITERKQAEEVLRKREEELETQSRHLKEVNTALKVLLDQREADKRDLEENVLSNVKQLVSPYLNRLKKSQLDADQRAMVSTLESNLDNIVSPFISKLSSKFLDLTPMEIRVADLVKAGRTNKEIAELLCISNNTILSHRFHIRSKLGLKNKGINLRSHLLSLAK